jgi:predicted RNA binding protein YcfA (HicA-like mRNA interferase family)
MFSKWKAYPSRVLSSSAFSASRSPHEPKTAGDGFDLVAALGKTGFAVIRTNGSHHFLGHEDGRTTVVAVHSGEAIGPGLLLKILRDCELDMEDLQKLL